METSAKDNLVHLLEAGFFENHRIAAEARHPTAPFRRATSSRHPPRPRAAAAAAAIMARRGDRCQSCVVEFDDYESLSGWE